MADFSIEATKDFWRQRQDSVLYRIISTMERHEDWTLDGNPQVEEIVSQLAKTLSGATNFELALEDKFIYVLSSLKAGRALRILQYLDSLKPGTASKLLIHAETASKNDEPLAGFFLSRNLVFERMQLLGRILQPDRVRWVHHLQETSE